MGYCADPASEKRSLFCLGNLTCGLPDSASPTELGWCDYKEGAGSFCLGSTWPFVLAAEVVESPVAPHFRPYPSSSCSRSGLQCPQPLAGLPDPAYPASATPTGLEAPARLPPQWHHPAQSLPQLQHGMGWAGGWGHMQVLGMGKKGDSAGPRCYQTETQNPAVTYLEMKMMSSLSHHHNSPEMFFNG